MAILTHLIAAVMGGCIGVVAICCCIAGRHGHDNRFETDFFYLSSCEKFHHRSNSGW